MVKISFLYNNLKYVVPCISLYARSADICKGDGSGQMRTSRGKGGGLKISLLADVLYDEPVSRDLSRNLSCKNAKP